ncbi:MAG: TIGR01777 family oxidoreductase [Acidimicrobiales bacterium]
MRVGVTGASGLIGSDLVASLRERGDSVVPFVRPTTVQPTESCVRWDPSSAYVDETGLRNVGRLDAVVHLAGAGIGDRRWSANRKAHILSSRIESTLLLDHVASSLPEGVGFVASASAIGWYGNRGDEELDETAARGDGFLADVCHQWEGATELLETRGTPVAHFRSGVVMSTRGGALKKQLPLFRYGLGGVLGSGDQWTSPISLVDEIRAILWIIDHQLTGSINLVSPTPVTNRDFTRALASTLHRPALLTIPSFALRAGLGREMAIELLLWSQRVTPRRLLESDFVFDHPDVRHAMRDMVLGD